MSSNIIASDNETNETKYICEFCHKEYKTKYTLSSHLKTSKKCIASRGDDKKSDDTKNNIDSNLISSDTTTTYHCSSCDYYTMLKTDLQRHILSCTKYQIDEKMKEKNIEISKLQWEAELATAKLADRDRKLNECLNANAKLNERVKLLSYYLQLIANAGEECSCGQCGLENINNNNDNNSTTSSTDTNDTE
jgi:hypothetical protein